MSSHGIRSLRPTLLTVWLLLSAACDTQSGDAATTTCTPTCGAECGTPDGCGGVCPCAGSATPPSPSHCTDTCASTQSSCGSVCGMSCGTCGEGLTCLDGKCLGALSCEDCVLQLAVRESAGNEDVEVEVRFSPAESDPRPRMLDLRVRPSRPVELLAVEEGPAMMHSALSFRHDAASGQAWKRRADGSCQVLIRGLESTSSLEAGHVATLRFRRDTPEPLAFALEKRAQTFAPLSADAALQATPYGRAALAP